MAKGNGFWQKAFSAIGLEPTEVEEDRDYMEEPEEEEMENYSDYSEQEPEEPAETRSYSYEPDYSRRRSKIIAMPENTRNADGSLRMKMMIYRPTSYEDTQSVIDNLKSRKPIIMNLDEIDVKLAQRILDFVSGAVYALGGDIRKAARNIFVIAPSNVDIATNLEDENVEYNVRESAI